MNDLISSKQLKILLSLKKFNSTFLYLSSFWSIATVICGLTTSPVLAQITPDTTLDNSPSQVNSQSLNNLLIKGGVRNQSNLFHSFQEFNVNKGQQVFFANPQGINNIITRITGNNPSNINGVLGINGLANLYFINPKGIIFGKDSRLDVKGSFFGSTAESLIFSDDHIFSAIEPNNPALLKINVPLGLQYGNNPAAIQLKQANLQVKPGKTLGLIGGNVSLDDTVLKAPGGTIQLGGLLASGTVNLDNSKTFSFPENIKLGDVSLTNKSNIEVIAGGGGDIFVDANNFSVNNSNLIAGIKARLGKKDVFAGNIDINVTGDINIDGQSNISNILEEKSLGNSGKIDIKSNNLFLTDSNILSNTNSIGNAGDLNIEVTNKFEIISSPSNLTLGRRGRKGLFSQTEQNFSGNAGNITVTARDITISGTGGISSSTNSSGNGGNIIIQTERLKIIEGAAVLSNTINSGNAGEILIKASEFIEISNLLSDSQFADISRPPGGIIADIRRGGTGNGGKITVETARLTLRDGAFITTDTKGRGDGGDITIKATELVEVIGKPKNKLSTQLVAAVRRNSRGKGGNLTIETKNLIVANGGEINVGTSGSGNSGKLIVRATESIVLKGMADDISSRLIAEVDTTASGDGGNITLETRKLTLADGAQISVSSQQEGAAGNLEIKANQIFLNNAIISADTVAGDKGSIYLNASDIRLRQGSRISTNATQTATGGNIDINTNTLVGLENSDITANAEDNFGGRVTINAEALFGIGFRDFLTLESDITATSTLGAEFNGVVEINTPDIDPTSGLEKLPRGFIDSSQQIKAGCSADGGNKFAETGRGGLPKTPQEVLRSEVVVEDWRVSAREEVEQVNNAKIQPNKDKFTPIVEARGWIVNEDGTIEFVANLPQDNISVGNNSLNCG